MTLSPLPLSFLSAWFLCSPCGCWQFWVTLLCQTGLLAWSGVLESLRRGTSQASYYLWAILHPTPPEPTARVDQNSVSIKSDFKCKKEASLLWMGDTCANPARVGPGLVSQAAFNNFLFILGFSEGCWKGSWPWSLTNCLTAETLSPEVPSPGYETQ